MYDLPPIVFVVDGIKYPIEPEEYILTLTENGIESPHEHSDLKDVV